jgi:hypothetical protein
VALRRERLDDQPPTVVRQHLTHPQLIAVTDNVNQAKGDQDPSTWQPSFTSYRCTCATMWIAVKYCWTLTLQSSEKTALQAMLNTCSS